MRVMLQVDWEKILNQVRSLKHKQRRKLIKKVKRSNKRKALSILSATNHSDDEADGRLIGPITQEQFLNQTEIEDNNILPGDSDDLSPKAIKSFHLFPALELLQRDNVVVRAAEVPVISSQSADKSSPLLDEAVDSEEHEARMEAEGDESDEVKNSEISKLLEDLDEEVREWHNPFAPENETPDVVARSDTMSLEETNANSSSVASRVDKIKQTDETRPVCQFYEKVGACRFGDRCSRFHPQVTSSNTLLLRGMFTTFAFEIVQRAQRGHHGDADDLCLEHSDADLYNDFLEFSDDVLPELETYGKVVQFKVCCNREQHLLGNVYVQYGSVSDATKAAEQLNGRFYGGKSLKVEFVSIKSWKAAICGLHYKKLNCPRSYRCNFLHVFKDPEKRFYAIDTGAEIREYRSDRKRGREYDPSPESRSDRRKYRHRDRHRRYSDYKSPSRHKHKRKSSEKKKKKSSKKHRKHKKRSKSR